MNRLSNDWCVGDPYNLAFYGLTLAAVAKTYGFAEGELEGDLTNVHIYTEHTSGLFQQFSRSAYKLPKLVIRNKRERLTDYEFDDFEIVGYKHHPFIPFKLYE